MRLWRSITNQRAQFRSLSDELANYIEDFNRNITPIVVPPRIVLEKSSSGSNCTSFDSTNNTSSDDYAACSDYESCNGGSLDDS